MKRGRGRPAGGTAGRRVPRGACCDHRVVTSFCVVRASPWRHDARPGACAALGAIARHGSGMAQSQTLAAVAIGDDHSYHLRPTLDRIGMLRHRPQLHIQPRFSAWTLPPDSVFCKQIIILSLYSNCICPMRLSAGHRLVANGKMCEITSRPSSKRSVPRFAAALLLPPIKGRCLLEGRRPPSEVRRRPGRDRCHPGRCAPTVSRCRRRISTSRSSTAVIASYVLTAGARAASRRCSASSPRSTASPSCQRRWPDGTASSR